MVALLGGLVFVRDAQALVACTAAEVSAQDTQCPAGTGPCTISKSFTIGSGCTLDFGPRAVTIINSGTIDIESGAVTMIAASLTIAPGGHIDGRGTGATPPSSRGGMLSITTTGAVTVQKGATAGTIDLSGTTQGGVVNIQAGGTVTIAGRVVVDRLDPAGGGGLISIRSGADIVTLAGSTVSATGGNRNAGGSIDFTALGKVTLGDILSVSGGDGGVVDIAAGGEAIIDRIDAVANGEAGSGGCVELTGSRLQLQGAIVSNGSPSSGFGGGCGGFFCAEARFGDIVVTANVQSEGAAPDGGGGDIDFDARGSISIGPSGGLSVRGVGDQGCGGEIGLLAALDVNVAGSIDTSGGFGGNFLDVTAGRDASFSGPVRLNGRAAGGFGGGAIILAGEQGTGRFTLSNTLDVSGGGCSQLFGCGLGGTTDVTACAVTITGAGSLLSRGADAGENVVTARDLLTIQGRIDATSSAGGASGANRLIHRPDRAPVVTGTVVPAATIDTLAACTTRGQQRCLLPCPACGDGLAQFPETCDTPGVPQACDGCSLFCETETCDDANPCTIDGCAAALGCDHQRIAGCTTTTTTTTTLPTTSTTTLRPTTTTTASTTTTTTTRPPATTTTTTAPATTTTTGTTPTTTSTTSTRPSTTTTSTAVTTTTRPPTTTTTTNPSTSTTTSTTATTASTSTTSSTVTTTTAAPTSTTTLPPPNPCVPANCDDANPCTDDSCGATGCLHQSVPDGVPSATCIYKGSALRPPICTSVPSTVTAAFDQARSFLERSGQAPSTKKARALVRKAIKALGKGKKAIAKGVKKKQIEADCAAALTQGQADALQRAQALL